MALSKANISKANISKANKVIKKPVITDSLIEWLKCGIVAGVVTEEQYNEIVNFSFELDTLKNKIVLQKTYFKEVLYNLGMASINRDYLDSLCEEHKA